MGSAHLAGQARLRRYRDRTADLHAHVDRWNAQHKIGDPVCYRKDLGDGVLTTTRSEAAVLSGHSAVIWLDGVSGCVALERVTPIARTIAT